MNLIDNREHKVKCDYGIKDYVKFYVQTNDCPDMARICSMVIKDYLKAISVLISTKGYKFSLPERMGLIEPRKSKRVIEIDTEGNIINKLPINWKATNKLWKDNPSAKTKKIKIRHTNKHTDGYVIRLYYIKKDATFKFKSFFKLQLNREMRRNTYSGIMNKEIDAFLLTPER